MTQHTFIAYRDQGNTLYEASHQHTIVIEDDDGVYDGVFYEDDYYSEIRDDNEYLSIDGVSVDSGSSPYIYHQSFYDAAGVSHQELFYYFHAEGAPSESFFMGEQAMKSLSNEAVKEIQAIFPQISQQNYKPSPVRYIPQGQGQKQLAFCHAKNQKPLLDANVA